MPLAPLGCATQCFVDTDDRTSWGPNSIDSWYIGTSDKHYRCYDVFAKHTKAVRTTDTIKFMHKWITSPTVQAADIVVAAAERLTDALQNNIPDCLGESSLEELERLADIFHQATLKLSNEEATRERAADPRVAANEIICRWTPLPEAEFNQLRLNEPAQRDLQTDAADPRVDRPAYITQDEMMRKHQRMTCTLKALATTQEARPSNTCTASQLKPCYQF